MPPSVQTTPSTQMAVLMHSTSRLGNCTVSFSAGIDIIAIDAWSSSGVKVAPSRLFLALIVDVFKVEGVDMAGDVTIYPVSTTSECS